MKAAELVFRFVGCLICCYLISVVVDLISIYIFHMESEFFGGVIIGGITTGLMVYYYQKRKRNQEKKLTTLNLKSDDVQRSMVE